MKLIVEPVPSSCLPYTLHAQLRACEWEKLCRKVDKQQEKRCSICGKPRTKKKPLIVQEAWEYTDLSRHQHLKGLVGLCPLCHLTKNIDQARREQLRGDLNLKKVETHFCRVNGTTPDVFRSQVTEALRRLKIRNRQRHWTTDLGEYTHLVEGSKQTSPPKKKAHRRHQPKRPALVKAAIKRTEQVAGRWHKHKGK